MRFHRLLSVCLFFVATLSQAAIPQSERDALLALFNSAGGNGWERKEGWGSAPGTECTWSGITCNEGGTSVIGIELYANQMSGTIPPQIRDLKNLRSLIMPSNRFASIPVEVTELANLETLNLAYSEIGGTIPREIGRLTKLKALELNDNQFGGGIPSEIGNLVQLELLYLYTNPLGGTIPPDITRLANLKEMLLANSNLGGPIPAAIGSLTNLERLHLSDNRLSGAIPTSIGSLARLVELHLDSNALEGSVPDALGQLRSLQTLELSSNRLTGAIPASLGNLAALRSLGITLAALSGPIPKELGNLSRLEILALDYNALTGTIPDELRQLKALRVLSLGTNQLSGTIPTWLGDLEALETLDLSSNALTGTIPQEIMRLRALRYLALGSNNLTGTIPPGIGSLTALTYLDLTRGALTGPIPATFGGLREVEILLLGGNQLSGAIPNEMAALTNLLHLDLSANRLIGGVPSWIGDLKELEALQLGGNQLGGALPASIGSLSRLTYLDIAANLHTGPLPREFANLTELVYFYAYQNLFEGALPELSRLRKLQVLQLESNRFDGRIPSLEGMNDLLYFNVSDNGLSGDLPSSLFSLPKLETVVISVNRFSGTFPTALLQLPSLTAFYISHNQFRGPLPRELLAVTRLLDSNSDLGYNAFFTNDAALREFMNRKHQGNTWEDSQTIAPAGVAVSDVTDRSAVVSWTPITYQWDEGGYELTMTPSGGGSPVVVVTPDKYVSSAVVRGLAASTSYSVAIRTITFPHDYQKNIVTSDATASVPFATGPRVLSPPIVDLAVAPEGLVQVNGTPVNQDSYVVTNYGDTDTVITLERTDESFDHAPATFTLRGGASQTVQLTARPLQPGAYEFYSIPRGTGVVTDVVARVRILSVARPAGTAIAQPSISRVEVAGERGTDSIATVTYTNAGTVDLSGIFVPDVGWIDAPRELLTIPPGESRAVNFTVRRSKRPDAGTSGGALSGNLNLLYVDGSQAAALLSAGPLSAHPPGLSVSTVTVVDTSKPPVTQGAIPPLATGEVARFIAGVSSSTTSFARSVSDVAVSNPFGSGSVNDLRLYYASANAATASVATLGDVTPSKSVSLANIVSSVYNSSGGGTVHVRSQRWSSIVAAAKLLNIRGEGSFAGAAPVFRSDRAVARNASLVLLGLMGGSQHQTSIVIQETIGAGGTAGIEFLDASGATVGRNDAIAVPAFGMTEITDVPTGAVAAVVTNRSTTTATLSAYARVTDRSSGDIWSVVDWSRYHDYNANEPARVVFAQSSAASSGGGRRRAASHATTASVSTDLLLFNRGTAAASVVLGFYDAATGSVTERQVQLAGRQTMLLANVVSSTFGRSNATGSIVVTPLRGASLAVSARTVSSFAAGSTGTAVPVIAAASGLRRGQFDVVSGLEESTLAAATLRLPGTSRTRFGIIETTGGTVKVRATILVHDGRSITSAFVTREYTVGPRQLLFVDNMSASIIGSNRDVAFGALHNLQLRFEVIEGDGAAAIFVSNVDNQSGDEAIRFD